MAAETTSPRPSNDIKDNDNSSLLEPDRIKHSAHTLRWYHQADFIIALGAICALVIGALGLADAIILGSQIKRNIKPGAAVINAPFGNNEDRTSEIALICFGVATAFAWTATQRASFRAMSMDAHPFLVRGVKQSDLDNILSLKLWNVSWFRWRLRLWKSSLFFLVQFLLYIGIGISYRRAFGKSTVITRIDFNKTSSQFLLGCVTTKTADYMGMYNNLVGTVVLEPDSLTEIDQTWTQVVVPRYPSSYDASSTDTDGWVIGVGWHGSRFMDNVPIASASIKYGIHTRDFRGPFLAGVVQKASIKIVPSNETERAWVELGTHLSCGRLPRQCFVKSEFNSSDRTQACFWTGLQVLNLTAEFSLSHSWRGAAILDDPNLGKEKCPVQLSEATYQSWIFRASIALPTSLLLPNNTYSYAKQDSQLPMFASLVATVQNTLQNVILGSESGTLQALNTSTIPDMEILQSNGLLVPKQSFGLERQLESCGDYPLRKSDITWKAERGLPIYTGSISVPKETDEWTTYQIEASAMVLLWGLLLAAMAWPFKRLIIKGQLNQYMSIGADLGRREMEGSSSGHWASESNKIWRLRHRKSDCGYYRIWFEEVLADQGVEVSDSLQIQTGSKYL